jgi:hypothetical protein
MYAHAKTVGTRSHREQYVRHDTHRLEEGLEISGLGISGLGIIEGYLLRREVELVF